MKYLSLFFILCLIHSSCVSQECYISDREKAVNQQMGYSAKMLSKKYNMRPCATSVAMPGGNIKYLELEFNIRGPLKQNIIREILISSVHDFLNNINNDKELCSYLTNGCMHISDVGITLFLHDTKGRSLYEPEIGIASVSNGKVEYIRSDPNEISIKGMKTTEESYEEALSILKKKCPAVQKRCNDSGI